MIKIMRKAAAMFAMILEPPPHARVMAGASGFSAGEEVSESSVLSVSTAWACINIISGTIATLPFEVYRRDAKGVRILATEHPLYRLLHDSPNADQTAVDFWEFIGLSLELHGNAYAAPARRSDGVIVALQPIRPDVMSVRRAASGDLIYRWHSEGKTYQHSDREMLHIRGFGGDPIGGLSTIQYGRGVLGLTQAMQRSTNSSLANGLRPSGVLEFERFLTAEQRDIAETKLIDKFAGSMATGRPMILEGGAQWKPLSITPVDAQLLESRGFGVEEVCRLFGVPPHMVGHVSKTTSWGAGVEQQTLGFQKYTLRKRLKRIEQAVEKQLLTPADRAAGVSVEFNLEGLLRGDSKSRATFYEVMIRNGVMTINECRALENLPPVEGGDIPRVQMQNVPLTESTGLDLAQQLRDAAP